MRAVVGLLLILPACPSDPPPNTIPVLDGRADDGPADGPSGLVPGSMAVTWMHGSANCGTNTDPEIQTHNYNANTVIFRQNKCDTFEAPFMYLLVGADRALLLDSGGTTSTALRTTVRNLIANLPLVVAHSHAHGDHVAGDATFTGQPNTTVIAATVPALQSAFAINSWPSNPGTIDLGNRVLDVIGIPGHEAAHIALYDRETGLLFTGDSVYPGFLFVSNWNDYRASIARLAAFAAGHPVAHVLGAHVEMTSTPGQAYPYMTTFQPAEHVLQLTAANIAELDTALDQAGPTPPNNDIVLDDFIISP